MQKLDVIRRGAWLLHARSAAWSTLEYLAYPLAMLAATPFFVASLGREGYGHWMTVLAVVGLGGLANAGMAGATIRFVSARRAAGDARGAARVVRQAWTLAGSAAALVAALLLVGAGLAGARLAAPLRAGAALLVLAQVDFVLAAALRGCERFALAARVELAARALMIGACLAVAYATGEVAAVLAAGAVAAALAVAARAVAASRALGAPVHAPAAFWKMEREVLLYAGWSWFQGAASVCFANLDRILIAALLGASAVTSYSVCTQLAAQIHALPAAALAFLFPLASRRAAAGARNDAIRPAAILAGAAATLLLAGALFAFGDAFMRLWMGEAFARELGALLPWLTAAYLLLGLGVAPHYLLLGQGEARFVSLNNFAGGLAASLGAALLIPLLGLTGGAIARALFAPLVLASYLRLFREGRTT